MNNKKLNTILYILVFVFVFVMFIATSYAYYKKVIKKDENKEVANFSMLVNFDKTSQINASNLKNGFEEVREFTIENYSEDTIGKYNISLEIITPLSNMIDDDFVYTLESVSDSKDTSNKTISIDETPVPVLTKDLGTGTITPKNTHTYKLTIKLNNNKYVNDSLFNSNIKISINN